MNTTGSVARGYGLVSKRLQEPALGIDELPPIDAVVLSHMHGDHWDRVSQKGLDHGLPIVTTPHAAKRLHHRGFAHALGLSTWQGHTIAKGGTTLNLTSLPGRHAPAWSQRLLPPVMGTMLEFVSADSRVRRLYVSGDTLLVEDLNGIPRRFDSIDAGLLHLGGTRLPAGPRLPFGLTVTMDGRQGASWWRCWRCRRRSRPLRRLRRLRVAARRLHRGDAAPRHGRSHPRAAPRGLGDGPRGVPRCSKGSSTVCSARDFWRQLFFAG